MNNKLFFICPDCCLESKINAIYGQNVYFLTALGCQFNFSDPDYANYVADFISGNKISEIFFASDVTCLFSKRLIESQPVLGIYAEKALTNLLHENFLFIRRIKPDLLKQAYLADLNVKQQINKFITHKVFYEVLVKNHIETKGLLLNSAENKVHEITAEIDINLKNVI